VARRKGRSRNYSKRCRKTRHISFASAETDMRAAEAQDPRPGANVYYCRWCGGWHWGHSKVERVQQLIDEDVNYRRMLAADAELREVAGLRPQT
jgi:hypothetical protein